MFSWLNLGIKFETLEEFVFWNEIISRFLKFHVVYVFVQVCYWIWDQVWNFGRVLIGNVEVVRE